MLLKGLSHKTEMDQEYNLNRATSGEEPLMGFNTTSCFLGFLKLQSGSSDVCQIGCLFIFNLATLLQMCLEVIQYLLLTAPEDTQYPLAEDQRVLAIFQKICN